MVHCPIPKCPTPGILPIGIPDGSVRPVGTGCPGLFRSWCPCTRSRPASGLGSGVVVCLSKMILYCCMIGFCVGCCKDVR